MESHTAIRALSALAHDTRLAIFRLLVQAGQEGLSVGEIGARLVLAPATLSFHLAALRQAGLVTTRRSGRTLYQAADYTVMAALVGYLSANCCGEARDETTNVCGIRPPPPNTSFCV
ncbi:transcriptional regulator, ArsR family [mine drainage metagenome]|uniref:Transcriptional regulator, ArsR family n=1 Tax=mine drainage metagenome TaxID=410659 RepID=T1AUQ0_9ZZZZ